MTREEAIREWTFRSNHIKRWLYEYGEEPSLRHYVELIDMAIEALQREEAEEKGYCHRIKPKQDLISREAAIKTFIKWCQKEFGYSDINREERFIDAINTLPSAKAVQGCSGDEEPGQWQTEDGKKTKAEYSVYCSKCGSWSEYRTKYCGNCGSLMKEENDDK